MGTPIFADWLSDDRARSSGVRFGGAWCSWDELRRLAEVRARSLSPRNAVLVDSDQGLETIVSFLAAAMVPDVALLFGPPARLGLQTRPLAPALALVDAEPTWRRPLYGTPTSGSTGRPKLAIGWGDQLPAVALAYRAAMPEYAAAELFATCSPLDFAASFYMVLVPALFGKRDLVVFAAHDWSGVIAAMRGRPSIVLGTPATLYAGSLSLRAPVALPHASLIPAGGYLTPARRERIVESFVGASFLYLYGSSEMGLVTVDRDPDTRFHVGRPLPGKPVWLEDVDQSGAGVVCTAGVDCRTRYWGSAEPLARPDGAVTSGDRGHFDGDGNLYLDGRADGAAKLNGVSVYPRQIERHILQLADVRDVKVQIDRSGAVDRLGVTVIGAVAAAAVRSHCQALPLDVRALDVRCCDEAEAPYARNGKL